MEIKIAYDVPMIIEILITGCTDVADQRVAELRHSIQRKEATMSTKVYLELRGVPFEAVNSFDLTGERGFGSVAVRIPEDWARKLGLLGERPETRAGIEGQTQ